LEDKLNETEEELILMEDEITELIDVVEETNKTSEQINQAKTKGQGRVAKMVSMREDLTSRKGSIKVQKEESRRVLSSSSQDRPKSERSRKKNTMPPVSESNDVEKLQNDFKIREAKLKADLEECNNREQRLDTWERELFELEDQLKKSNNGAENSNSEHELLITSLQEEKEDLHKTQIETQSKLKGLEFENDDLRVKLDRVTKMATENQRQIPVKSTDLADAQALVEKKEKIIKSLEDKIEILKANGGSSQDEEDGKDLLIRELQNQLVNTKKEASSLSSGNYVTRLKLEIKKLRESVRDLKKRLKDDDATFKSNLQKQDDSMRLLEKQMQKLKIELERRDKREKNFGTDKQRISDSDLQNHIEDLEDEISHWKSTNADLENEIEDLKANVNEEQDYYLSDDDIEDDCSIGSLASVNSRMSLSVSHEDNFFLTDSTHSVGNLEEPQTPNRAMRTVSNLWSKMRNEPPNTIQAFPYGPGSLND
jgi:chromosome segregation ATPase